MTSYRSAVRDFTKGKRNEYPEEPEVPELKLFFIPANSSSAMVIKHLQESGGVGVIFETYQIYQSKLIFKNKIITTSKRKRLLQMQKALLLKLI